jgi:hypothetical protein
MHRSPYSTTARASLTTASTTRPSTDQAESSAMPRPCLRITATVWSVHIANTAGGITYTATDRNEAKSAAR